MEQYFYLDVNKVQQGPVDGSQLVKFGVTPTTLVWKQGMAQWTPAGQVPELAAIFNVLEEVQQPQRVLYGACLRVRVRQRCRGDVSGVQHTEPEPQGRHGAP